MSIIRWPSLIALILILFSCGKSLPTLDGVDIHEWKNDKNGCSGKRMPMLASIQAQTEKLLSLSEQEIISILGKPDENELYTRNQKFYYYNIDPSPSCSSSAPGNSKKLVIRFNAVGLAKEVAVE
jgi:hypothetical protein